MHILLSIRVFQGLFTSSFTLKQYLASWSLTMWTRADQTLSKEASINLELEYWKIPIIGKWKIKAWYVANFSTDYCRTPVIPGPVSTPKLFAYAQSNAVPNNKTECMAIIWSLVQPNIEKVDSCDTNFSCQGTCGPSMNQRIMQVQPMASNSDHTISCSTSSDK